MGETADVYQVRWEESQRRYAAYKSDGKSPAEINRIFEQEILERMKSKKLIIFSFYLADIHTCEF